MNRLLIVFGLILVGTAFELSQCTVKSQGIVASKQSDFENQINRFRSQVATGSVKNHNKENVKAANMYQVSWNSGLANSAQNCADLCPQTPTACQQLQGINGYVQFWSTLPSESSDWSPQIVINEWASKSESARQILWGSSKVFGCGRSVSSSGSTVQYIVCFFDQTQKQKSGQEPYTAGGNVAGGACLSGTSSGYTGLCASNYVRTFVAHKHHLSHNAHKKKSHKKNHHHHQNKKNHKKQHQHNSE